MKRIKVFLLRRKITSVFFAALLVLPLVYASFTFANTNVKEDRLTVVTADLNPEKKEYCTYYKKRQYFNDAAHTTAVGFRLWTCDGEVGGAGTVTPYYDETYCECFPEEGK